MSQAQPPIFLVGFPRSGTTLVDRFLGRHSALECIEEKGLLDDLVEMDLEPPAIRETYWQLAAPYWSGDPGRRLVDRMPMAFLHAPLIQELWSGAPIIFALRHPMDVVLSCFMQDFRINALTRHFESMDTAVDFYCRSMTLWLRDRQRFAPHIFELRYESLIANPTAEMRVLIDWLGLDWEEAIVEHVADEPAAGTASYHQVAEPVYDHAVGRWQRYRDQLAPWLDQLRSLAVALGYELDCRPSSTPSPHIA